MQDNPFANKVIKTKKLGKNAILQVSENQHFGRIYVDFQTIDGKLKIQKTFRDDFEGRKESKEFQNKFKTSIDIRKYFGLE